MKKDIEVLLKRHNKKFNKHIVYSSDIEIIIDEVCIRTKLSKADAKKIIDAQFRMLKQVMSNEGLVKVDSEFEEFKSIRLMRLGSFRPSDRKFMYLQKHLREKEKNV